MSHRFDKASLIEIIEDSIRDNWKRPAYSDYGTDINFTYGDVARHVVRLHAMFRELGINPGDKIALCDKNSSRWAIAMLAILTYGAVGVPILSDFSLEQIQNIYDHSESKLMFCGPKLVEHFPHGIEVSNFSFIDESPEPLYSDFAKLKASKIKFFREEPDDLAIISYTSGSTGNSKGVMLPYRSLHSNAKFVSEYFKVPSNPDFMPLLPLSHMLGFAFEYMYGTCVGAHLTFLTKVPSPNIVMRAFNDVKPFVLVCVPLVIEKIVRSQVVPALRTTKIQAMLKVPGLRNIVYRQIRSKLVNAFGGKIKQAVIGGAPMSSAVEELLAKIKFPYSIGYGMTECGPLITYDMFEDFRTGSCGRAIHRMHIKIDSPDPQNQAGEILTRGRNVMLGYYKNPEETAETIDADGWLHTGDLGTIDADGYLFIRGRKKTMLLGASGQNIYPEEIESKILNLTPFEETVVVQRGEKLVGLVYIGEKDMKRKELTPEQLTRNLDAYRNKVNEYLPKFSQLSSLEIHATEFEKTPKRSIRRYLYK